jgi:uncharacterized membrane protein HdeD (DUF308 family)
MLPVLNLIFSVLVAVSCFIPLYLYWWKRLAPDKSFLVVAIFWTINGITYIPEAFKWQWYASASNNITLIYNLIDAPLIIVFFYYAFKRKVFLYLLAIFIIFEIIMNATMGFNWDSDNIIIGMGSLLCLVLNIWGISLYFRNMEHTPSENVLVFVNAGFIFYYGLFPVIYYYNYIKFSPATLPYVTFVSYFSICMATGLISYGLWKNAVTNYREERY